MATGRKNRLTQQIGEFLVAAELGKQELIATPFAGNVPEFDILVADEYCRVLPIQVKTSNSNSWKTEANKWMDIKYNEKTQRQKFLGLLSIANPELIYVFVKLSQKENERDRFFILRKEEYQKICKESYCSWMDTKEWIRPRNPKSFDCRPKLKDLKDFENNWDIIKIDLNKLTQKIK